MPTESVLPPSSPPKTLNAIDCAQLQLRSPSYLSIPGGFDSGDELSPLGLEDEFYDPINFIVAESARGVFLPNSMMDNTTISTEGGLYHTQDETTLDLNRDDNFTSTTGQSEHDDSNFSALFPPLPDNDDSSLFPLSSEDGDPERTDNQTMIEEREMRRKLMDMESSFLPEPSTLEVAGTNQAAGVDDTYLVGVPRSNLRQSTVPEDYSQSSFAIPEESSHDLTSTGNGDGAPPTPSQSQGGAGDDTTADLAATPATCSGRYGDNTTVLETMPSSPAAEAAARSISRKTGHISEEPTVKSPSPNPDSSLQQSYQKVRPGSQSLSPGYSKIFQVNSGSDVPEPIPRTSSQGGNRPRYLTSRQSANRLSYSSATSNNTEVTNTANTDATLSADYALQSGGAVPDNASTVLVEQHNNLTRSMSLGSLASGISGYSDENPLERRLPSGVMDGGLHTLTEEEGSRPGSSYQQQQQAQQQPAVEESSGPMTPKAKPRDTFPTDTAIAERVKDIQVPSAFVKQFREDFTMSPDKRTGLATPGFTRSGRTMTLKEQSSTIDRLSKENFDLKMRIHFLNEALNRRSEEGIKEMISENVELKSDKLKLQKDNQSLKKKLRDLEKQLKDQQSDKDSMVNHDPNNSDDDDRDPAQDEEILFLRERVETYELEIERLRSETIARESEKRRLAEMVKALSDRPGPVGSDVGSREERDMWKDMLDAETAAREQAEEENKGLRDEVTHLRNEMNFNVAPPRPGRRDRVGSVVSYSTTSEREFNRNTTAGGSSNVTLVEELRLLRQENAELRKEVSAQTSMLTSRNKEKERLYQEIEELKLGQRRPGSRSIAGDSIFDRSASRAQGRSSSRDRDSTGLSRIDDAEREDLEVRNGNLRDQVSGLKLENQSLRTQLEDYVKELEALDKAYQADVDQAEEEIQNLQQERDQALQMAEEHNAAFQDLRAEAQEELDTLGDELDQKIEECQRLGEELRHQDENLRTLQSEMRSATEGILRLEEDAQNNLQRYEAVQHELEECNGEMESLEKSLYEANTKVQRLTVQIESSQNEIAFLREEQDGDKIRIGDLESELKTYKMTLQTEKDKTTELEEQLAEERHQREVIGSREKQEVQRIMNELNREASAAKEEVRKLKRSLSAQEIETATWRERLMDLENNLREILGDLTGSRSSLITNITKLQKELESTSLELESIRSTLDEKESLLRNRDALLESHGLESRKLAELLERERQARRADKQSFEQALKSHHQASRTITQNNSRISELELARNQDRKRHTSLEQQYKDQLNERNSMLLTLWKRLSTICGPDWAHSNSLINGNLPSQEVIGNILFWPGFSRNLLLAVKTVETVISGFKGRIKSVDRDLTKQYQAVEHTLSLRIKKLDRLEESMMQMRAQQQNRALLNMSPEMAKLRGENRLLKAELNLLQSSPRSRNSASAAAVAARMGQGSPHSPTRTSSVESGPDAESSSLVRHQSVAEKPTHSSRGLARSQTTTGIPQPSNVSSTTTLIENAGAMVHGSRSRQPPADPANNEKWMHRLHELEKRLKAEREARLLDRSGARKRLEERDAENQRLRAQLERQRVRRGLSTETITDDELDPGRSHKSGRSDLSAGDDYGHHEDHSSSEGEGIILDIEV